MFDDHDFDQSADVIDDHLRTNDDDSGADDHDIDHDHDSRADDIDDNLSDDNDFDHSRAKLSRRVLYMGLVEYNITVDSIK